MFSKNIAITDTTDGLPNPRRIWAVIAASLALIMSVLDANIVNVKGEPMVIEYNVRMGVA